MKDWLPKYIDNVGQLPSAGTLRKDYLQKVLSWHKTEISQKIQGQLLSIMIDPSPDWLSGDVVNIIVHYGQTGERFLIGTRFLNEVNNIILFDLIDDVRQEYNLK